MRVHACGVCRTDLHVTEGELPVLKSPVIPGHQVVGVVERNGPAPPDFAEGARVGVAWLHSTDGTCEYCRAGNENLCEAATFTGHTVNGGYAEYVVAREAFAYRIPDGFDDLNAAPLLCAGIIGFRCLRVSEFAAAERWGCTDSARRRCLRFRWRGIGASECSPSRATSVIRSWPWNWARSGPAAATMQSPEKLNAAIIFAPAGELVPAALANMKRGGTVVLGGIHMSPIPAMSYDELLYWERVIRSVANNTRQDGEDFLKLAADDPGADVGADVSARSGESSR